MISSCDFSRVLSEVGRESRRKESRRKEEERELSEELSSGRRSCFWCLQGGFLIVRFEENGFRVERVILGHFRV